jgi:ankyrin repeat protein
MEAATNGNLKMVQYLVENSADVNHAKPGWDTPAQAAIRSNRNPQVIQYLLNRPDIDLNKTGGGGETLSETAIRVGNKDAFGILLNKCSEDQLNELNQNDLTPLMMAALLGRLDMVKELVERGAEIDARNSNGDTASLLAASVRGKDIMEFLKQHGASQQTTNRAGLTADQLLKKMEIQEHDRGVLKKLDKLLKPDMSEEDVENIKKLIETIKSRDNLNMVYEEGCTILGVAAFSGNRDIVTLLTDRGAKVCITNEAFRRPFQSAIDNGDVAMLKLLFKKGGEQGNPINPQWFLCMAAGSAKIEVVRFLVNEGADVNTESPDWDWFSGLSPSEVVQGSLRSATRNKKKGEIKILNQIMTLLEECGANP